MLEQALTRILNEYPVARNQPFTNHPLGAFIRRDVPQIMRDLFPQYPNLIWDSSAGMGRWADAPWITVYNPLVTDSPQRGYYPAFLFTRSLDAVYLSMSLGMTELRDEFGHARAKELLIHRASILRARLDPEYRQWFDEAPIDLQPSGSGTRLAFYVHAFGRRYARNALPNNNRLISNVAAMLQLYQHALIRGGTTELEPEQVDQVQAAPGAPPMTLEEKRTYRLHRTIERNARLAAAAKEIHGYTCKGCGFNFERVYGEIGRGYIEAHHLTPLSQLPEDTATQLSPRDDFTVVCSNCHRMIHRRPQSPLTMDELRRLLS
jgi:5-methylcytosine-specific restriction protein A